MKREKAIEQLLTHTYGHKYIHMLERCEGVEIEGKRDEAIKKAYIYESCKYDAQN